MSVYGNILCSVCGRTASIYVNQSTGQMQPFCAEHNPYKLDLTGVSWKERAETAERALAELRREYQHSQNAHELALNQRDEARHALEAVAPVVRATVAEHLALYDQSVDWTVYHKHRLAKEAAVDAYRRDRQGATE